MRKYIDDKLAAELRKAGVPVHSVNYINIESGNGKRTTGYTIQRRTPERDAEIRQYHKEYPDVKHNELATMFRHGASTISKILQGEKHEK